MTKRCQVDNFNIYIYISFRYDFSAISSAIIQWGIPFFSESGDTSTFCTPNTSYTQIHILYINIYMHTYTYTYLRIYIHLTKLWRACLTQIVQDLPVFQNWPDQEEVHHVKSGITIPMLTSNTCAKVGHPHCQVACDSSISELGLSICPFMVL